MPDFFLGRSRRSRYQAEHHMPLWRGRYCIDARYIPSAEWAFTFADLVAHPEDLTQEARTYLREVVKWCRQHPREMWEDWQVELMQAVDK